MVSVERETSSELRMAPKRSAKATEGRKKRPASKIFLSNYMTNPRSPCISYCKSSIAEAKTRATSSREVFAGSNVFSSVNAVIV